MCKDDVYIIIISDGNFDQGIIDFNLIDLGDVIDRQNRFKSDYKSGVNENNRNYGNGDLNDEDTKIKIN